MFFCSFLLLIRSWCNRQHYSQYRNSLSKSQIGALVADNNHNQGNESAAFFFLLQLNYNFLSFCRVTDVAAHRLIPLQLSLANIDYHHHQYCGDLLPPPSPVSSSYSELRRATDNAFPPMPIYPSTSQLPNHTYANLYQSDYTYASYQPPSSHQAQVSDQAMCSNGCVKFWDLRRDRWFIIKLEMAMS